jgi:ubiquinone/menaquinone biosynthesis C-methylase UbiE
MNHNPSSNTSDVCPAHLAGFFTTPLRRFLHKPEKILAGLIQPGQVAADFGCGPGYFTLQMARQAGPAGRVYAVDIQSEMLNLLHQSGIKAGVQDRISLVKVQDGCLHLPGPIDFGMCFWMVHEVPDRRAFLQEIYTNLNPGGNFLIVEPRLHVSRVDFQNSVEIAEQIGFRPTQKPSVAISYAQLFTK